MEEAMKPFTKATHAMSRRTRSHVALGGILAVLLAALAAHCGDVRGRTPGATCLGG
jgi:hypothetical protein